MEPEKTQEERVTATYIAFNDEFAPIDMYISNKSKNTPENHGTIVTKRKHLNQILGN